MMPIFTVYPVPKEVLEAPDMQEHSVEPAVGVLRKWLGRSLRTYYFRRYKLTVATLEALPAHVALAQDEAGHYHFRRPGRSFVDVTKDIVEDIKELSLPLPLLP